MTTGQISRTGEEIFEREILSHFEYVKIPTFSEDRVFQILQLIGCDYLIAEPDFLSIEFKTRSKKWGDDFLVETHQNGGPGWIETAKSGILAWLWLDSLECAVIDLQALKLWWGMEEPTDYREIVAKNHKGEISRNRIIPFDALRFVPYKRAKIPLTDPGEFLNLN
jgi:hypothetical protein